ncbi:hypothetical protein [Azospirillum griseum]|uniref:Uncharacterized protein n=1 Tax=Azospirillum griseum TaxID=2496639 RepID=A0A3S0K810_9PROT|nr:hypothetical protein [Azospirillum griseum]RTR24276.1 hypothetical protein EJ903_00365 [Azospirillum griseum]
MNQQERDAFDSRARVQLTTITNQMNDLRTTVERFDGRSRDITGREPLERALDSLRGLRNRAAARIEAAHQADDDAWPTARAHAERALREAQGVLDDMSARLHAQAA